MNLCRQQLMLIFFMDFTAFLVIYLKTDKFQVVIFLYRDDGVFRSDSRSCTG